MVQVGEVGRISPADRRADRLKTFRRRKRGHLEAPGRWNEGVNGAPLDGVAPSGEPNLVAGVPASDPVPPASVAASSAAAFAGADASKLAASAPGEGAKAVRTVGNAPCRMR